ncbi:MAG: hypothetical protein H0W81_12760 [Chloroflexi bacterium]|nr:hypothetical protein [Chloroflexota bacterium]
MSRVSAPALRGTLLGALLRLWNPLMRRLLDSPVHWPLSRWFAVLAWSGRRTGRRYSTPVSYVREGTTAYVTTGDRWWRKPHGRRTGRDADRGALAAGERPAVAGPG